MKIFEVKGINVYPYFLSMEYKNKSDFLYVFKKVPNSYTTPLDEFEHSIWYLKEFQYADAFYIKSNVILPETIDYEKVYGEEYEKKYLERTDKDVIKIVKELGTEANTRVSDIKIVEIPDDFEFEIHDYDGLETLVAGKGLISN